MHERGTACSWEVIVSNLKCGDACAVYEWHKSLKVGCEIWLIQHALAGITLNMFDSNTDIKQMKWENLWVTIDEVVGELKIDHSVMYHIIDHHYLNIRIR